MSLAIRSGVRAVKVAAVADEAYYTALEALIAGSRARCLCSVFIVDVSPFRDSALKVDGLLLKLREARWRGVDCRLLIGGSRSNLAIAETAAAARRRAGELGLPCRWLTGNERRGSHMKLVISDDQVLTGSHNWSPGAFHGQTQDSVLVRSAALTASLADKFEAQWQIAGTHVSL